MKRDIERRFHDQMLAIYEAVGRRTGYWAHRFLRLVKKRGGFPAAKYFLNQPAVSEGFARLSKVGFLKFSVEALVLQKPWSQLFNRAEKSIARQRLENSGNAAVFLGDKRDKRRLKNVFVHLLKTLRESDENDLIRWENTFPIKPTYKTDGWKIKLGTLGRKRPSLELWIDHFPSTGHRCYWFGFYSDKKHAIQSLIEGAPARLAPKRVLRNRHFTTAGGGFRLKQPLKRAEFNQPIHEIYYKRYSHFGMFDSTDSTSQGAARMVAQRVAKFFVDVLHDSTPIARTDRSGAGFGDAETNRLVERAAIKKATQHLEDRGYRVVSRERDCVGYDLEASRAKNQLHVEVKGVSGTGLQFPITKNEVKRAESDRDFLLIVVTQARSPKAKLRKFRGRDFKLKFHLTPLSFMATKA